MDWESIDWTSLERLRRGFLAGSAGQSDYWRSDRDLFSYDQTYAQRIGWKWDYVLEDLARRGWSPPVGGVLDWGCGSGIAGRAYIARFGHETVTELVLADRSALAMAFAKQRARQRFPELRVRFDREGQAPTSTLLLSHVLSELDGTQLESLVDLAKRATAVLWVEPGTHEVSRRLSQIRDRLLATFRVVAPCTHQNGCPMLLPANAAHWCHHFASPPPSVFTDSHWSRFALVAGIDLRSLPLSFLALDQRPAPQPAEPAVRVIGRPRIYKAHALLLGCDATGLTEKRLSKRNFPEVFRQLKKGEVEPVQTWHCDGDEIVGLGPKSPTKKII